MTILELYRYRSLHLLRGIIELNASSSNSQAEEDTQPKTERCSDGSVQSYFVACFLEQLPVGCSEIVLVMAACEFDEFL